MKINAHVTDVSDNGDKMKVSGQGRAVGDATWRPWLSISIDMPITKRTGRPSTSDDTSR
jgi:hypothetical protein